MTEFARKVIAIVKKIPRGRVATYSQVAALAGKPHAARGVTWILSSSSGTHSLPWQRVISSRGRIAFPLGSSPYRKQKALLMKEKVKVASDGSVALEKFGWAKKPNKPRNQPRMFG